MVKKDWLRFYDPGSEPGRFGYKVQSWDTANKSGELNDYSAFTTWGILGKDIYLLHVYRKKLNFPDLKRSVIELYEQYKPSCVLIEDKASGTQLIQELRGQGVRVGPYTPPPGNDKQMRLSNQTICFENGHVFLPREASWLADYVAELTGFPGTRYNDQVDSTTQFLDYFTTRGSPMIISEEVLRRSAIPDPYSLYGSTLFLASFSNRGDWRVAIQFEERRCPQGVKSPPRYRCFMPSGVA